MSVNDLKSRAINAARLIRYRLSHLRADQCYAAIVLVPVARRSREPEDSFRLSCGEVSGFAVTTTNKLISLDAVNVIRD